MIYCLDTDICIFALKGRFPLLKKWFQRLSPSQVKIPSIVRAELLLGAMKSSDPKSSLRLVGDFLEPFEMLSFGASEAAAYANVRYDLERKGSLIGPNDLIIAAIVLSHHATLITHNINEFKRVAGLMVHDPIEDAQS